MLLLCLISIITEINKATNVGNKNSIVKLYENLCPDKQENKNTDIGYEIAATTEAKETILLIKTTIIKTVMRVKKTRQSIKSIADHAVKIPFPPLKPKKQG